MWPYIINEIFYQMGNSGLTSTGEVAIFDPASFIGDVEFGLNSAP
jgi:fructosamine-3-kinase